MDRSRSDLLFQMGSRMLADVRVQYAAYVGVDLGDLEGLKGKNDLKEYTFHTHSSKHYFCSVCGIHTHHQSRMTPSKYVVNLSCIEGVKIEDYAGVDYFNGREHPKDKA